MRRFLNLAILVSLIGVIFSGFVYWMANSSHQDAERRRQQGEYIPPGNAVSVARNMGMTCAGFVVVALAGLSGKILSRTRRSEPPHSWPFRTPRGAAIGEPSVKPLRKMISPKSRNILALALFLLSVAYVIGSQWYYACSISPRGVASVKDFVGRFGEPWRVRMIQRDGQDYYEFNARGPKGCLLATPSAPPAYVFRTNGEFVTWCKDPGDMPQFRSTWSLVCTNQVEFDIIRERFGLR